MRTDLDFLFQKAMRSDDYEFVNAVWFLLIEAQWFLDARILGKRAEDLYDLEHGVLCPSDKFSFFVEELDGDEWYG